MSTEDDLLAPSTDILISLSRELHPAALFTPTPKAAKRVLEFFTALLTCNIYIVYIKAPNRPVVARKRDAVSV